MPNFLSNCRSKGLSSTNRHLFRINELGGEIRKTTNRGLKVNWNYYKVGQLKDSLTFLKEWKNIKKKKRIKGIKAKYFTVGSQDPSGRIQSYPHLVLRTLDLEAYVER